MKISALFFLFLITINSFPQANTDSLPSDFPKCRVTINTFPAPGRLFFSNYSWLFGFAYTPYLVIMENDGTVDFAKKLSARSVDFKYQPNGLYTYMDGEQNIFYAMDRSYNIVDSFYAKNGFLTDSHELRLMPNGHALLLAQDIRIFNMQHIYEGGDTAATVIGQVIQELDENKNVVFEWNSWDHFEITDATRDIDLKAKTIDWIHGNSIEIDYDANLLLSSRHLDEVTKINRTTGEVMWRWGGKNSQFKFLNDSIGFSHQHTVSRLPNGHILMFDNGNLHQVFVSRVVEYEIDEIRKTARLVWQYTNSPAILSMAMGSAQRLSNGNTLIGWGSNMSSEVAITEVTPAGEKVFEMTLPLNHWSYRVFRFEDEVIPVEMTSFNAFLEGSKVLLVWKTATEKNNAGFEIEKSSDKTNFTKIGYIAGKGTTTSETAYSFSDKEEAAGTYYYRLKQIDFDGTSIYSKSVEITREVINNFNLSQNYPNPVFQSTTNASVVTIPYTIPSTSNIKLDLFNALGEKVRTVVSENKKAGKYEATISVAGLASGIYFYSLCANSIGSGGNFVAAKKMLILK